MSDDISKPIMPPDELRKVRPKLKPKERDTLRDYRDQRSNEGQPYPSYEPEYV